MARGSSPGFRVIVSLTDQFTRPLSSLNQKIGQSTSRVQSMAAGAGRVFQRLNLGGVGNALGKVGGSVLQLRNAVTGLLGPFARLGALAGGFALGKFVTDAVQAGNELVKMSAKTGVAIESLQRLQYAAKQEGVGADAMTAALVRMNKAIGDATKPAKKLTEAQQSLMSALGFSAAQVRSGTIKSEEALLRLADAMQRTTDPAKRARIASALLGKSYAELLPVLSKGRAGIEELGKEAAVMSDSTARSAKMFSDTMTTLAEHVKGVAYEVLEVLLPSMTGAAGAVDEWVRANKEWLKTEIVAVIRNIVDMGKAFVDLVRSDIIPALRALKPIWDALVGVIGKSNAMLLAFTAVVAPSILVAIASLGKSLLGLAVAMGPVGLAIAGIAAASYLAWPQIKKDFEAGRKFIEDEWSGIKLDFEAGGFEGALSGVWNREVERITKDIQEMKESIIAAFEAIRDFVTDLWSQIGDAIVGIFRGALDKAKQFVADLKALPGRLWRGESALATGGAETPVAAPAVTAPLTAAAQAVTAPVAAMTAPITEATQAVTAPVAPMTEEAPKASFWESIKGAFTRGIDFSAAGSDIEDSATALARSGTEVSSSAGELAQSGRDVGAGAQALAATLSQGFDGTINVNFSGVPQGTRINEGGSSPNLNVNLNTSYAGPRGAAAGAY